jgi:hypothetical protein
LTREAARIFFARYLRIIEPRLMKVARVSQAITSPEYKDTSHILYSSFRI